MFVADIRGEAVSIVATHMVDNIALVRVDSPPVNALGHAVRSGLLQTLNKLERDERVRAIVVLCAGRTFFVGADISEFDHPPRSPLLPEVLKAIDASTKPIIAAIHGHALGGGFEFALACHFRVAVTSAKVGLPEVKLGILPAAGGTQRLPRLVGPALALEMIVHGEPISAVQANQLGMIDVLANEGGLREAAIMHARAILDHGPRLPRISERTDKIAQGSFDPLLFDEFRQQHHGLMTGFKSPSAIVKAIEAAVSLPFERGLKREQELFAVLRESAESSAQRYYFFSQRKASNSPRAPTPDRLVESVGIIGDGALGGELAERLLGAGISVTQLGVPFEQKFIARESRPFAYETENKGRLGLVYRAAEIADVASSDLVIDVSAGSLESKRELFIRLGALTKTSTVIASATNYADHDVISALTGRSASAVGMHFLPPTAAGRLLEVMSGPGTAPSALAAVMTLGKRTGHVPVRSGSREGGMTERLFRILAHHIEAILRMGGEPEQLGDILETFGFAPRDLGLSYTPRLTSSREPAVSDTARSPTGDAWLLRRILYPIVNEGAKLLEQGEALCASDIDVAAVAGIGWPVYTGGPMHWADMVGLSQIVDGLKEFEQELGDQFRPTRILIDQALSGSAYAR